MTSLRLVAFVAFFGLCAAAEDYSKLETLLKSIETLSPNQQAAYNYAPYHPYPYSYPYSYPFPDAVQHNDLHNKNAFLSTQLDAAHKHIDGLQAAHETHRQAHLTIVERLEADIVRGHDEQVRLLAQIRTLNKTIHDVTTHSALKTKLVEQLVNLVVSFQKLNLKLYSEIHALHEMVFAAEQEHHTQLVELKKVVQQANSLIDVYQKETSSAEHKAFLEKKNYREDDGPSHRADLLLDHYKHVEAGHEEKLSPQSAAYYDGLVKVLEPLHHKSA
ncbi:hypothetical protein QR680_017113 [Steinernema hermaphroditum]|uniref:Uncharacterized protein n=1 Tax=Steinernema hermaphroditum TaxID=289476 RepID=A0AA39LNN3_9BILA|nr:hypothetical protein QR680_017113 [Steinernema hermaphroditum]